MVDLEIPAPWEVVRCAQTGFVVIYSDGRYLAGLSRAESDEVAATLMAAAPELYEALYELTLGDDGLPWGETSMSDSAWDARQNAAKAKARSALAKANGA